MPRGRCQEGAEQIVVQLRTRRGLSGEALRSGSVQSIIAFTQHLLAMPPAPLFRCTCILPAAHLLEYTHAREATVILIIVSGRIVGNGTTAMQAQAAMPARTCQDIKIRWEGAVDPASTMSRTGFGALDLGDK